MQEINSLMEPYEDMAKYKSEQFEKAKQSYEHRQSLTKQAEALSFPEEVTSESLTSLFDDIDAL